MDLKQWNKIKSSGNFRRKVRKTYLELNKSLIQDKAKKSKDGSVENKSNFQKRCFLTSRGSPQISTADVQINDGSQQVSTADVQMDNSSPQITIADVQMDYESDEHSYDSLEDDDENNDENDDFTSRKYDFPDKLKKWAVECNISHTALKKLLTILNELIPFLLPKDPRTLLRTNDTDIFIDPIENGSYWHNGLKKSLKIMLDKNVNNDLQHISLNVNIDGLPIYKSSRHQLWPILCNISEMPYVPPMVVGIFEGQGKPVNLDSFLRPFVTEIKELMENRLQITTKEKEEKQILVNVRAFICDSPARALIKGTCNFNGKHGCLKCTVIGEYSQTSHTVTFLKTDCPKRNDEDFRLKKYGQHHKYDSPLLELPIDMVNDIPVGDSLHLLDLGIMKRLLTGWRDGNFGKYITKWRAADIQIVSQFLASCKMPKEIHRSIRTLDVLCHWKGSEYRTFLLYLSLIVLKDVLPHEAYEHYTCFFCAVTIMSNEKHFTLLRVAEEMMKTFVQNYGKFYGKGYITSNVHNLIHVIDEVKRFGKLQNFNAYPFENKLYSIKKMLRQGNNPLSQIARRLSERTYIEAQSLNDNNIKRIYVKQQTTNKERILILHFETFILSKQERNKWFLSTTDQVVEVQSITEVSNEVTLVGKKMQNVIAAFDTPIESTFLNIYKCNETDSNKSEAMSYTVKDVKCKLVATTYKSYIYFVPLLHTL